MEAKKYIIYRPDESDLTCCVYVRCDWQRYCRKHKSDACYKENDKEKHCDEKKHWHTPCEEEREWDDRCEKEDKCHDCRDEEHKRHDRCEKEDKRHDRCEKEDKRHDHCEEDCKKPWEREEEQRQPEPGRRHAKRSKKDWQEPYDSEEDGQEQPEYHDPQDSREEDMQPYYPRKDGYRAWKPDCPKGEQTHVHEFLGSAKLAEEHCDCHNHRFAGVSGEEIPIPGGHVHRLIAHTDFFDHFHDICQLTGPAIYVDDKDARCKDHPDEHKKPYKERKHVHFVEGWTSFVDGHKHEFQAATLIESPLLP